MKECNRINELLMVRSAAELTAEQRDHLAHCLSCQEMWSDYEKIVDMLMDIQQEKDMQNIEKIVKDNVWIIDPATAEPLPEKVRLQVEARKKRWQQEQLRRTFGLLGVSDPAERNRRIKQLLVDPPADLPKAAFPDDLLDDRNGDGE